MPQRPRCYRSPIYKQHERLRGKTAERGYGGTWKRLRLMVLHRQPICGEPGCNQPAEDVHHVDGNPRNNLMENLQGLCHRHHSMLTRKRQDEQVD